MTSSVIITAHCSEEKEVEVGIAYADGATLKWETTILQNGEFVEKYVYDNRTLHVRERLKGGEY